MSHNDDWRKRSMVDDKSSDDEGSGKTMRVRRPGKKASKSDVFDSGIGDDGHKGGVKHGEASGDDDHLDRTTSSSASVASVTSSSTSSSIASSITSSDTSSGRKLLRVDLIDLFDADKIELKPIRVRVWHTSVAKSWASKQKYAELIVADDTAACRIFAGGKQDAAILKIGALVRNKIYYIVGLKRSTARTSATTFKARSLLQEFELLNSSRVSPIEPTPELPIGCPRQQGIIKEPTRNIQENMLIHVRGVVLEKWYSIGVFTKRNTFEIHAMELLTHSGTILLKNFGDVGVLPRVGEIELHRGGIIDVASVKIKNWESASDITTSLEIVPSSMIYAVAKDESLYKKFIEQYSIKDSEEDDAPIEDRHEPVTNLEDYFIEG